MGCISRIELSTPESHSTASAFAGRARPERRPPLTEEQKNRVCHECGKKGHIRPACPQLNKEKQDTARVASAEKKMNGKKQSKSSKAASSSGSDDGNSDYDAFGYRYLEQPIRLCHALLECARA